MTEYSAFISLIRANERRAGDDSGTGGGYGAFDIAGREIVGRRQVQIHDDYVGIQLSRERDRFREILSLSHDLNVAVEIQDAPNSRPQKSSIAREQYCDWLIGIRLSPYREPPDGSS